MTEFEERIAHYLSHRQPDWQDVSVTGLARIHGGASRETYRFRVGYREDGTSHERALILRRDPLDSLIETERANEFHAYQAFHPTSVPVPEPLWLEGDASWLDRPFFVMEEIENCVASPQELLAPPYLSMRESIGEQMWRILGEISRADPKALGLLDALPAVRPQEAFERELSYWEGVLDEDELEPQPIARAAIRWLRRNPPPPSDRLSVVHADFRTGNFLVDRDGTIRGILDWEMAHLGDPLEDLAWSINRTWCWARDDLVGGLLPRERAVSIWEASSGLTAEPEALRRWELFSSVKAICIWISSGRAYRDGPNKDPVLGFTAWWLPNAQDRAILETMGRL